MRYSEVLWVRSRNVAETLARLWEESEKRTDHRPALRFIKVSTSSSLSQILYPESFSALKGMHLSKKKSFWSGRFSEFPSFGANRCPFGVQPAQSSMAISH
jgi:hypothetical protein